MARVGTVGLFTRGLAAGFLAWLACAATAWAEGPVLHERVFIGPPGMRCRGDVCTSTGPDGTQIRAIEHDGQLIPAPTGGPQPAPGEQVFTPEPEHVAPPPPGGPPLPGDPPPERRPMVRMDRDTGADVPVASTYHAVFTPSEFPYKRMSALDWADDDETLSIFDPRRRPVPLERPAPDASDAARDRDRDRFWGSIVVELEPDRWVPLPSVAAESRLLDYRTEPPLATGALEFARDGADNYYVRAHAGGGGKRRLVWLVDAPRLYFAGPIFNAPIAELPRGLVRPLPPRLRKVARGVLDALGIRVTPRSKVRDVLDPLVEHFRGFAAGQLPSPSESTYRDLALGKKGVCRHRAFAFAITAMAAGLPARYVENELHVFVEVYLPVSGWRRINLGGAALDDRLAGADDKPVHHPRGEDDLPRPPEFLANATPPARRDGGGRRAGGGGAAAGDGTGPGAGGRVDLEAVLAADAAQAPARLATRVAVAVDAKIAYRGDTVDVSGQVLDATGRAVPDMQVEIYLDASVSGAQRLATARSGPDGRFELQAAVPATLRLGDYAVVARAVGDATHRPSSSRPR